MQKNKKSNSTKHLENIFMNTPVVSATESTGSGDFIWETTLEEKTKDISGAEAGTNQVKNKKKK